MVLYASGGEPGDYLRFMCFKQREEEVQRSRGRNKFGELEEQKEEPQIVFWSGHSKLHALVYQASCDLAFTYPHLLSESHSLGGSSGVQVEGPWEEWGNLGTSAFLDLSLLTLILAALFSFKKKERILIY